MKIDLFGTCPGTIKCDTDYCINQELGWIMSLRFAWRYTICTIGFHKLVKLSLFTFVSDLQQVGLR